jgi:hypothetical protein
MSKKLIATLALAALAALAAAEKPTVVQSATSS